MVQAVSNTTAVVLSLQESLWPRLASVSSNLSNANTVGFKALTTVTRESQVNTPGTQSVSFAQASTTFIDSRPGPIQYTGNTYDVAVQGDGYFSVGPNQYTRGGQFQVNAQGQLTTMHGDIVQGSGGSTITIPPSAKQISISSDGTISSDQGVVGKLAVMTITSKLDPIGFGKYSLANSTEQPAESTTAKFIQGAVEGSNVEPIAELLRLSDISRQYEQAEKAMEMDDERQRQVINVAA